MGNQRPQLCLSYRTMKLLSTPPTPTTPPPPRTHICHILNVIPNMNAGIAVINTLSELYIFQTIIITFIKINILKSTDASAVFAFYSKRGLSFPRLMF